jgi:hypothetical protein
MRRLAILLALAAISCAAMPATGLAEILEVPAVAPPQFRALLRAKLHSPKRHSTSEARIDLGKKHGVELAVVGEGNVVAVEAFGHRGASPGRGGRPPRPTAVTAYVARGTATSRRIGASFGRLGHVSMRFHPSGRVRRSQPRRHCRGPDHFTYHLGVFVGSIRFGNEGGGLSVRVHRARGRIRTPLRLHCALPRFAFLDGRAARPVHGGPSVPRTFFTAGWRDAVDSVEFAAFQITRRTLLLAVSEQSLGSAARISYALAIAPDSVISTNDALTEATVEPPAPFAGKGVYRAAPDGSTKWSGTLAVLFPGEPRLSLSGPLFKPTLRSGF